MKVQHLGELTKLPPVPDGKAASLLILENRDQASNLILKSGISNLEDKDVWFDNESFEVTTTEDIAEHWPDGFETVLITFEPTES